MLRLVLRDRSHPVRKLAVLIGLLDTEKWSGPVHSREALISYRLCRIVDAQPSIHRLGKRMSAKGFVYGRSSEYTITVEGRPLEPYCTGSSLKGHKGNHRN